MNINMSEFKNKILGCWFGKNIGGTLGMPFEWKRQINNVNFYTHKIDGEPIPNDDLDIQLLWLIAMEQQGVKINTRMLSYYFSAFVTPHWGEYGVARTNMKIGMTSPLCGLENNVYKNSCGSYIRSEIWACICPATPELAVKYMLADSQIDHGGKTEGTYAAIAIAAMQSAAFVESDIDTLIDIGMSYIPDDCAIASVTKLTRACYSDNKTYIETRDEILDKFRGSPFTYYSATQTVRLCSSRDCEKGFDKGERGYDVPSNFGLIILALLYGKGDIGMTAIIATNCGEDTDCTAATACALLGVIMGYDKIPREWIDPIGDKIKTCCLNYGELDGVTGLIPADIFDLTQRTISIAKKVKDTFGLRLDFSEIEKTQIEKQDFICTRKLYNDLYRFADCALYDFTFFDVAVDYNGSCYLSDGETKRVAITIQNKYRIGENIEYRLYLADGFDCTNSDSGVVYVTKDTYGDFFAEIHFDIRCDNIPMHANKFVFEATIVGRGETMLVPLTLFKKKSDVRTYKIEE